MVLQPRGIIPAMVTPLDKNEELDLEGLRVVARFLLDAGVHGLFPVGSQGEFWALSKDEKEQVWKTVVDEANGKVPVYAGAGAESTRETVELARLAKDVGCDAASIITPYFISPKGHELVEHYRQVAEKADIPVVLYNNPPRTGVRVPPEAVEKLVQECSNVVGIKDSSGDLTTTMEFIRSGGPAFSVLAGRDTLIYATLLYGGKGAIAACGNVVPRLIVDIYEAFIKGDHKAALEAQYRLAPLRLAFELGTFPAVIKEAMEMVGLPAGPCRKPVLTMDETSRQKLRAVLKGYGLLKP